MDTGYYHILKRLGNEPSPGRSYMVTCLELRLRGSDPLPEDFPVLGSTMILCPTCGNIVPCEDVDWNRDVVLCSECVRSGKTVKSHGQGRLCLSAFVMSIGYLKSAQALCCDPE